MIVALAQINPVVGDIDGNVTRIIEYIGLAKSRGAELVVFPELALFGYPPRDLVLRADLVKKNHEAVRRVAAACEEITGIVGFVEPDARGEGKGCFNSAALCRNGEIIATYAKTLLPTYDVFDERRYFNTGKEPCVIDVPTKAGAGSGSESVSVGILICEDLWNNRQFEGRHVYGVDPVERTVQAGADLLVNISASPFRLGAQRFRETIFADQVRAHGVPLICVGQVGGNDDLIFDGASMVFDDSGRLIARAKAFEEDLLIIDSLNSTKGPIEPYPNRIGSIRQALILGLRDYAAKCGFEEVVVGLSGGIDSAVTAALAVEALGPDRVHGVAMPSRHSSKHSVEDARELATNLGIGLTKIPIEDVHASMECTLEESFRHLPPGVAEENIQARIRGNILMALSNKFGWLLLSTGNKSELAVGFCTLYGDMSGGVAVLSDVPKTVVYELARFINDKANRRVIPQRTIEKPPSAELHNNQRDDDRLPPYEVLDAVLEQYIEHNLSLNDIVEKGFDRLIVEQIARMVQTSEHKRRQMPVGFKVTSLAFGTGRRMPIAARY